VNNPIQQAASATGQLEQSAVHHRDVENVTTSSSSLSTHITARSPLQEIAVPNNNEMLSNNNNSNNNNKALNPQASSSLTKRQKITQ
jgi:hypothetical protein